MTIIYYRRGTPPAILRRVLARTSAMRQSVADVVGEDVVWTGQRAHVILSAEQVAAIRALGAEVREVSDGM